MSKNHSSQNITVQRTTLQKTTRLVDIKNCLPKLTIKLSGITDEIEHKKCYQKAICPSLIKSMLNLPFCKRTIKRDLELLAGAPSSKVVEILPKPESSYAENSKKRDRRYFIEYEQLESLSPKFGLDAININHDGEIKRKYSLELTDEEVDERVINNCGYLGCKPIDHILEMVKEIRLALKYQRQLSFQYKHKGKANRSVTVNPLGVINNSGHYLLIAKTKNLNSNGVCYFNLMKMSEIDCCEDRIFPQISIDEVKCILSEQSESYVLSEKVKITLKVRKSAYNFFVSNDYIGYSKVYLSHRNEKKSEGYVSFNHNISINFLRFILSYGSSIEVINNEQLKEALAIQQSSNPNSYKLKMSKVFPMAFSTQKTVQFNTKKSKASF
jgi:hypothetical protein